jgi:hypothetical protein
VENVVAVFNFGICPGVTETFSNMNFFNDKSATSERVKQEFFPFLALGGSH